LRRRLEQSDILEDRLAAEAIRLREEAKAMEPGAARQDVLRKARQVGGFQVHQDEQKRGSFVLLKRQWECRVQERTR
jgi:hypothetical protein